jgi:hypothetical protein
VAGRHRPSCPRLGLQRREFEELNRKLRGQIEAIAEACAHPAFRPRSTSWRVARRHWRPRSPPPTSAPLLHSNLAEIYRRKVANPQAALADPKTQTEALQPALPHRACGPTSGQDRFRDRAHLRDRQHGRSRPQINAAGLRGSAVHEAYRCYRCEAIARFHARPRQLTQERKRGPAPPRRERKSAQVLRGLWRIVRCAPSGLENARR